MFLLPLHATEHLQMRYSLRTMLILMLLAGPLGAWGWTEWQAYRARMAKAAAREQIRQTLQRAAIARASAANGTPSPAAYEIYREYADRVTWESFPESQPPAP